MHGGLPVTAARPAELRYELGPDLVRVGLLAGPHICCRACMHALIMGQSYICG